MPSFSDRLADAVRRKGPLCVGIDPRWEMLPKRIRVSTEIVDDYARPSLGFLRFQARLLELIQPFAGIVKPQAAFYELIGSTGLNAMRRVLELAKEMGFVTILDAKRGDIASTADAYAQAAFGPTWNADALTINPYLGRDAVEPFLTAAKAGQRGVFVLVRTSNAGAGLFQDLPCNGRPLYRHVADEVVKWNARALGACGLGDVGAVVGATHPRELAELRTAMRHVWFLVPGYGAQGASAADVKAAYLPSGLGAVVNSSRGVTFPFHPDDPQWEAKIVEAAKKAAAELAH
ncbi:MAG TPA: orotidine-5'-phosphate decarboxylase [Urbifossiella sp.]|jgi:orotidine-5'-phosphate decarboxylase|nr:orotidine-5'-phosphate decarboxylase [Urbifossiella sp.]